MKTINVVLADDHLVMRASIRKLLEIAPDIKVVGEANNGIEALRLVETLAPHVLVLDIEMPQMTGIEVARRLQAAKSSVSILMISAYDDWPYIESMLELGVAGYLTKTEAPKIIVEAVQGIGRGEQGWLGPQVAKQIAARISHAPRVQVQIPLTEQEKAVLRLVGEGKTNREIEQALGLSEKLVDIYLEILFAKLGITSRAMAVKLAGQRGMISGIL
jgi:DNA-binding NarL/FixJ family response regulator